MTRERKIIIRLYKQTQIYAGFFTHYNKTNRGRGRVKLVEKTESRLFVAKIFPKLSLCNDQYNSKLI